MLLRRIRTIAAAAAPNRRLSTAAAATDTSTENASETKNNAVRTKETVGKRLLRLVHPKRSAAAALSKWKEDGRPIGTFDLNLAVRELRKLRRYKHALEVCEWRTKQDDIKLQAGDYALHLDLVAKVHGITRAEKFFRGIPAPMLNHAAHSALLHCYVQNRLSDKAESLMAEMLESGLVKNALPFNHMLSLYIANGQLERVPELIREMKSSIPPDAVTYNMWLTCCVRTDDVGTAEEVFSEMKDAKLEPDWMTYSVLSTLFAKNGFVKKATASLKEVERLASRKNRVAYSSLLSLRTNIGDKAGMRGVWKKMKMLFGKLNDAEYTCMISSLLKLDEVKEAEELYAEWESVTGTKDSRVGNLLLAAYINGDKMSIGEEFFERMTKNGIKASYTTLEILTWGYLKRKEVEKAVGRFESALSSVAKWIPDEKLVREVFGAVEEEGNVEVAEKLLGILRNVGYLTTAIYNSVLRTYAKAGKMPLLVEERMRKDDVRMDDETRDLVKITSKMCVTEISSDFLKS